MHSLWHWLLWCLAAWSHDPATLAAERARCAGCVVVAYAALAQEQPAPKRAEPANPAPDATPEAPERVAPKRPFGKEKTADFHAEPNFSVPRSTVQESWTVQPCPQCHDTGRLYRSDGGWVRCPCGACATGRCPTAR